MDLWGFLHIRTRSSVRFNWKRDSSDQTTCFQSSTVHVGVDGTSPALKSASICGRVARLSRLMILVSHRWSRSCMIFFRPQRRRRFGVLLDSQFSRCTREVVVRENPNFITTSEWIPSHVDIFGNEQADRLAREGCSLLTTSSPAITYSEHQSKVNRQLSKEWKIPPSHHWYAAREPGSFLDLNCDRASKTAISRLASGHTKSLSPSLRAGRLLSSAPSARFSRPLPNISWTVWVFPEKTCTILPFLLSIF
ncbi:uncharacterized protein TNCV_5086121 [Trichonephila clavipes]|uniref:RNase H type-1 domain-containing protein n=1 Tax=Trichonephila clavipes TaxID=2585209 RepID=A0A8X6S4Q7_TRICX|nr:uncharacterized protein TNCV_5086121 [Trichonephila clavipes]